MENIILIFIQILFILGIILILISNPTSIIQKSKYNDIIENSPFYGIVHMKKVIYLSSNNKIIEKLKRKILIRKIGYGLLLSIPILIILKVVL